MARNSSNPGGALVMGLLVAAVAWFLWTRYLKTGSKIDFGSASVGRDIGKEFDDALEWIDNMGAWDTVKYYTPGTPEHGPQTPGGKPLELL